MIPSFDPILWRRASWTVLALALVAFVSLGLAEQGSHRGGFGTPPRAPLLFERHRVFGLNLAEMSSLQALDWLNAAGNPSLALVVVPIDADVVQSLAQEASRESALTAIESIRQAAGGSPLAVCLHKPPETVGGLGIAQAAVGAISGRFPDQVVYVGACDPDADPGWQRNLAEAARPDADVQFADNALIPLSGGVVVLRQSLDGLDDLSAERLRLLSGGGYALYELASAEPLTADTIERAAGALTDTSQAALLLITPRDGVDPAALAGSITPIVLAGDTLPEGFSGINAPAVALNDEWQRSNVGTIGYLRASASGAALRAEFVGTDVYLMGIQSPDSGLVRVWLDPESATAPPTIELDLSAVQARDAAIPIARGLPAARHRIIIQAVTDDAAVVTISGLFVAGRPATPWIGIIAAATVLVAAITALSERCYTAIATIRQQSGPPRRRPRPGHPRVFARDR